ncbi:hypothetical protein ACFPM3_12780 [Streptomyces coeruleoprunus]|uniref:Uncharacterized protein n=1 Tax=Streptomyces coeruleoprunus TaxID=285563 RepID=A0ABV9XDK6_9ACTN
MKVWLWTGGVLGGLGVTALVAVAVADLGRADQIASVCGAILALAGVAVALYGQFGGRSTGAGGTSVVASGERSVAAGGGIGAVSTGDNAPVGPAPSPPPCGGARARGPVTASGDRSVAAGGDIGSASTGDA